MASFYSESWFNMSECILLASQSPRRRELIQLLERPVEFLSVDLLEEVRPNESPEQVVMALSFEKAYAAFEEKKGEYIYVGSDTVVSLDGCIYGKPSSVEDARQMLQNLSGREHDVFSGIAIVAPHKNIKYVTYVQTKVTFRNLSSELIQWYLDTGEAFDKAGAYGIQGKGARLISKISGDFYNVVGLPIGVLDELLTQFAL